METYREDSAQTSIDFLTGMSIFALTIIFVLQFTGGSLVTVGSTSTEKGALADRTAAILIENRWGGNDPGVVNQTGADDYFSLNTYQQIENDLAIPDRYDINITVRNTTGEIVEVGLQKFNTTDSGAADIAEVGSKKRVAYMQGPDTNYTVVVEVKVW